MEIDLGAIAKKRRLQLGLTRREVADRVLCSTNTILNFEQHERAIRLDILQDILKVLGLRLAVEEDIQKQGEWVLLGKDDMDWYQTRACSECDCHWLGHTWEIPPKQCPNCGAYMRRIARRQNNE